METRYTISFHGLYASSVDSVAHEYEDQQNVYANDAITALRIVLQYHAYGHMFCNNYRVTYYGTDREAIKV